MATGRSLPEEVYMRCYEVTDQVILGLRYERAGGTPALIVGEGKHRLAVPIWGHHILADRARLAAEILDRRTNLSHQTVEAFIRKHQRITHLHFAGEGRGSVIQVDHGDDPRDEHVAIVLVRPPERVRYTSNCATAKMRGRAKHRVRYEYPALRRMPETLGIVVHEQRPGLAGEHLLAEMAPGATLRLESESAVRYLKWTGREMRLRGGLRSAEPLRAAS
jgi:hypothetical protein